MNKLLEIGQWIACEDGIGQVLSIKEVYRESFEESKEGEKVGELRQTNAICKILCDFDGRIKKRKRIKSFLQKHCTPITSNYQQIIDSIKNDYPSDYYAYILYDDILEVSNVIRLRYKVSKEYFVAIHQSIERIRNRLLPAFTFKDFAKEIKKENVPINLKNFIGYGCEYDRNEIIEIILNNRFYKQKGKEKIFDWVKVVYEE